MPSHWAEQHIRRADGPVSIVRVCAICGFVLITKKPPNPGRGWGFREGNKQRGEMIQHIKSVHADRFPS